MTPTQIRKSLFALSFVLTSKTFADTRILEDGSWSLWESTSGSTTECYVQSEDKALFRSEEYIIEIHKAKNVLNSPVEAIMRIDHNKKGNTGLTAAVKATGSVIAFSDMDNQKSRFWGVAKNLSLLVDQLKQNRDQVKVTVQGGAKNVEVEFGGDGFQKIMTEMQNRCNFGNAVVDSEFENEFLGSVASTLSPTLPSATVSQLRALYLGAFVQHSADLDARAYVAQILRKYKPITDELNPNRAQAAQLRGQDLPQSQSTLADAKKQQVDSKAQIVSIDAATPGLTAKVQSSQKAYDSASAIIAPLQPEYNRLANSIQASNQWLSQSQSRLSDIDSRSQNLNAQINSMNSEAYSLQSGISRKRNDLDNAQSVLDRAQSNLNNYNTSQEQNRRLNANGEYARIISEAGSLNASLSQAQATQGQTQAERNRAANDLAQCQATTPAVDCGPLQLGLNAADTALNNAANEVANLVSRRDQLNQASGSIERQVQSDVNREHDALANREQEARRQRDRISSDVRADENRIDQLQRYDIPRSQQEVSQLASERPTVVSNIGQATSDVDRLNRDLASFRAANGWDKKAAAVQATGQQLSTDQSNLASAQSQKTAAQLRIEKSAATEILMVQQIANLTSQLNTLDQRAAVLQQGLQTLPAERAPYDAKSSALQTDIKAKKELFLNLLR